MAKVKDKITPPFVKGKITPCPPLLKGGWGDFMQSPENPPKSPFRKGGL